MSHIIIYVDKELPRTPFLSFCTNAGKEDDKIRFTYLCYDNRIEDQTGRLNRLFNVHPEERRNIFFITDSEKALIFASDSGIASAALRTGLNGGSDLSAVLYCIEDIEYISLERIRRMWQRSNGIPWIITETQRMVIREQTVDDLDDLYGVYSDSEAARYMEGLYEDPQEEADYLQSYINSQYRFFEYGIWALTLKDDGSLIGRAGISLREGYDIPEIGYIIGKKYRRQGYASEAVRAILDYGSREFGFDEYMAFTTDNNIPSIRLLESLGFSAGGHEVIRGGEHTRYTLTKLQ